MRRRIPRPARLLLVLGMALALMLPVAPALGQAGGSLVLTVDNPTEGATVTIGTAVTIGGWAVDPAGAGTGVDKVSVYLDSRMEAGGTLVGEATYGKARPDVAAALGNPALANSGFDFVWTPTNISPGPHTLYIYARSAVTGWAHKTISITVRAQPTPTPAPAPPSTARPSTPSYPSTPYYEDAFGGWYGPTYHYYPVYPRYMFSSYPYYYYHYYPYYTYPYYNYPIYPIYPAPNRPCIMIYPTPPECYLP